MEADPDVRRRVLSDLVLARAIDASGQLIQQDAGLWWVALTAEAQEVQASPTQMGDAHVVLWQLLEAAGPAAIGSRPDDVDGGEALFLLAVTAPGEVGLWRQVTSREWAQRADELFAIATTRCGYGFWWF